MAKRRTPADPDRWENFENRGDCMCYPKSDACRQLLEEYGLEGIRYVDGYPDFTPVAVETVEVAHMTSYRTRGELQEGGEKVILNQEIGPEGMSLTDVYTELSHNYEFEGNFALADATLAQRWTEIQKDGHGWSPAAVEKYRHEHKLTWDENPDCCHMMLVPSVIHNDYAHSGAVAEMNERSEYLDEIGDYCYDDDAPLSQWHEDMEDETDPICTDAPCADEGEEAAAQEAKSALSDRRDYAFMHGALTIGLLIGAVSSYIQVGPTDIVRGALWLLSQLLPYVLLGLLCLWRKGLPRFLQNRFGGILMTLFIQLMQVVVGPQLVEFLYVVYLIALGSVAIRFAGCFASGSGGGELTIDVVDEDGNFISRETRTVYGDMDAAVRQAENEARRDGYEII